MSIILVILAILGIVIAVLIGLLLVLLAIALLCRLEYKIKVVKKEDLEYDIRVKWLFGIIKRKVSSKDVEEAVGAASGRPRVTQEEAEKESEKQSEKTKKKSRKVAKEAVGAASGRPLDRLKGLDIDTALQIIGYTLGLIKKIFATFAPKRVVVRGRYGAENPATTGKVLAMVYAVAAALNIKADVEGNFDKEELILDIRALGYFRLWVVFWPMVRYILRPEIWRLLFPKRSKEEKKEAKKAKKNNLEVDENGHRI